MNHSVSLFAGRLLRAFLLILLAGAWALAGNSKLTGRVVAGQTDEALPGANVVITHTVLSGGVEVQLDRPLGGATDVEGYYVILNVPPGIYTVKASMIGYAPEIRRLVKVESDRTITVDFHLVSSDVQLSDVVVTAQRDIVRPDVSATQEVISTTRIEQMPVLRLDEFVGRVKGVTLVSGAEGNGLSVRGGSIRETDVRLDGISLQDPRTDNSYLALNSTTVQEVQVLTGGFEAKYGGIRSGLLNVVTKEGQRERYTASFKVDFAPAHQPRFFGTNPWSNESWIYRVYAGEYAMRGSQNDTTVPLEFRNFLGWRSGATQDRALDSTQKLELWKLQHPQYGVATKPDYFLEGSITGPFPGAGIPILGDFAERTTFLLGFKYENSQLAFPVGPRENYLDWNGQVKLTTQLQDNMKLSVNGMYAKIQTSSGGQRTSYGGALVDQNSSFGFLNSTESSVITQARLLSGGSLNQIFNKSRLQYFDQRYIIGGAKFTHTLGGNAYYTLDPKDGSQAYQGIVALEGDSIAEILQNYMTRSEQLETRLWLASDGKRAAGMLLQKLPERGESPDEDAWGRATQLADTLKPEELLNLPAGELVHRLYHEEDIRLFDAQTVTFRCTCSRENVAQMLRMLGRAEVDSILDEREDIEVHCEFCNERYVFDRVDADAVFADIMAMAANKTLH